MKAETKMNQRQVQVPARRWPPPSGIFAYFNNLEPITLIAGPCQLESYDHAEMIAARCADICERVGVGYVFKSSFDKANRSDANSPRGVGFTEGLAILDSVRSCVGVPVITDVHEVHQCEPVAQVADILQIPALLCRQTDLIVAAAETGAVVNIKKGPFMAPWDMEHAAAKVTQTSNQRVLLTERGTTFGYNNLVVDYRSLDIMKRFGYPVIFDATHSVQLPGGDGGKSGGQREFVAPLAYAAAAVGVAGLFLEVHDDPDNAPSDGPNMLDIDSLETVLRKVKAIDAIAKERYP